MQIHPTPPSSPTPLPQAPNEARFSKSSFSLDSFPFLFAHLSFLTSSPYGTHSYPHSFLPLPNLIFPPLTFSSSRFFSPPLSPLAHPPPRLPSAQICRISPRRYDHRTGQNKRQSPTSSPSLIFSLPLLSPRYLWHFRKDSHAGCKPKK